MAANEYTHGEMDISEHASTYALFMFLTKWGSLAIAATLVLLVLWFCTPAGFLPGFIAAAVTFVLGFLALKDKPDAGH